MNGIRLITRPNREPHIELEDTDTNKFLTKVVREFWLSYCVLGGSGSSVGIGTDYGLEGPGSNPCGDEIFCPSRPALGPTQPSVKSVPNLSPWG